MKKLVLIICLLMAVPLQARAEWPVGTKTVMNGSLYVCPSFDVWKVVQFDQSDGTLNRQCTVTISGDKVTVLDAQYLRPYGALKVRLSHQNAPGFTTVVGYVHIVGLDYSGEKMHNVMGGITYGQVHDPNNGLNPDGTPKVEHIPAPEQTWGGLLGIN